MSQSISSAKKKKLFDKLKKANTDFQKIYPGDRSDRQPVHTVYGGANLFKSDSAKVLGLRALEAFNTYAPDFVSFGKIFGLDGANEISAKKPIATIVKEYNKLSAEQKKKHPVRLSFEVYNKVINKLNFRCNLINNATKL